MSYFKNILICSLILGVLSLYAFKKTCNPAVENSDILSYTVDLESDDLRFFWKNLDGNRYKSIEGLKTALESRGKQLLFGMNGGMYDSNHESVGLYVENGTVHSELNVLKGEKGNFYLEPNGVFFIDHNGKAQILPSDDFNIHQEVNNATQSGPMLLIHGEYHPAFNRGSENLNIRNGVGILPNGNVLFAMSKERINFYNFAKYFKDNGCLDALYLDGFVSRMYLPEENWIQLDGDFGVIIGVVE